MTSSKLPKHPQSIDSLFTERLLAAEQARREGTRDYTTDEFHRNMLEAIAKGAGSHGE